MSLILALGLACIAAAHLVDAAAIIYVRGSDSGLVRLMARLTDIGLSQWYLVPAGLIFLVIAFLDWGGAARARQAQLAFLFGQAGYAFLSVAVAGLIGDIIKILVGRARPKLFEEMGTLSFHPFTATYKFESFPSGHSTTLGAVAIVLMLWFPRWRPLIFVLCAAAAATRIAAEAHYPSDVVAGFLLGSLYALFLARWLAARRTVFRFRQGALFPTPRFRVRAGR